MDKPLILISGLLCVFTFGTIVALLGSIKLKLVPQIRGDDLQFGKIVSVLQITMVIMAILTGILRDNVGYQWVIVLGGLLSAAAIFLIGSSTSTASVAMACVLLGIGAQFVNIAGNTLLPTLFQDPAAGSNLGNAFFGLGALLIPAVTARLLQSFRLKQALSVVALIALLPTIAAFGSTFPTLPRQFDTALAVGLLGNIVTWLSALTLFCYIGLEVSMATWITTYASDLGADHSQAANTLSIFFVFMMISRLLSGLQHYATGVDLTPNGGPILFTLAMLSAGVILWMTTAPTLKHGRIGVAAAGFLFGPIFPTTIGVTFQHFDPSQWGTLFGVIFAIGLLGATWLPVWIGLIAKGKSVRVGLRLLTATSVVLAVLSILLGFLP